MVEENGGFWKANCQHDLRLRLVKIINRLFWRRCRRKSDCQYSDNLIDNRVDTMERCCTPTCLKLMRRSKVQPPTCPLEPEFRPLLRQSCISVTSCTGGRSGRLAGSPPFLVTGDAMLLHYLFFFQLTLVF